jgi:hypothetical protein
MKALAALVGFALLASDAQAQSLKDELSEQCGKRAAEIFAKQKKFGRPNPTSSCLTHPTPRPQ